jgi:hypothetical protein
LSYDPQKTLSIANADCRLTPTKRNSQIGNWQIGNDVAGMTRLELANQLIEDQSAFHFAFIPKALLISDCQLPIGLMSKSWLQFCNWKLAIGNVSGARGEI